MRETSPEFMNQDFNLALQTEYTAAASHLEQIPEAFKYVEQGHKRERS